MEEYWFAAKMQNANSGLGLLCRCGFLPERGDAMQLRTVFLGRLIGIYCIVCAILMAVRRQFTLDAVTALLASPMAMFVTGVFTLILGLAIILGHNYWSGGALRVIVTLVGWVAALKAVIILFLPTGMQTTYVNGFRLAENLYLYSAVMFVLGAYLTWAGFRAKPE